MVLLDVPRLPDLIRIQRIGISSGPDSYPDNCALFFEGFRQRPDGAVGDSQHLCKHGLGSHDDAPVGVDVLGQQRIEPGRAWVLLMSRCNRLHPFGYTWTNLLFSRARSSLRSASRSCRARLISTANPCICSLRVASCL